MKALIDGSAWMPAVLLALWLRFDLTTPPAGFATDVLPLGLMAIVGQMVFGRLLRLYPRRWRFASFEEIAALVRVMLTVGVLLVIATFLAQGGLGPRSVPFIATPIAIGLATSMRFAYRVRLHRQKRPRAAQVERVVVFGAGDGAAQILPSMLRNPESPFLPVALLDDDPTKRRYAVHGVRVEGTLADTCTVAARFDAGYLLVAIPSAGADVVRRASEQATACGLKLLVLPSVENLFGKIGLGDIRPVSEADLLGRHRIDTDVDAIAGYVTAKRVLVTGAGGSIGSEIARQLHRYQPAELILLDRDESALHAVQLSIEGRALLDSPNIVLCDIRDADAVHQLFLQRRPQVVFHAAALKHLPMLERHPDEALKTNVVGTQHLLDAAVATGVERFVNISTDKAADPTSVLGRSKLLAERLTADAAARSGRAFVSVRFGNVLGSRGSVLVAFRAQIAAGGPVTVTHPEVTRYFMTVEEAVQLTVQAGAIGAPGECLVLDMGNPVRILDVARRLVAEADRPVRIEITGLRPGEKLHEHLFAAGEVDNRPLHPLISHVVVSPITLHQALKACAAGWLAEGQAVRNGAKHCTPLPGVIDLRSTSAPLRAE